MKTVNPARGPGLDNRYQLRLQRISPRLFSLFGGASRYQGELGLTKRGQGTLT